MKVDLVVRNGKIVTSSETISGHGLVVNDGKVIGITLEHELPEAVKTIDAQGHFILPGAVDPHHHYGFYKDFKEECRKGTMGATFGGMTTVIMMNTMKSMLAVDANEVPHPPTDEMYDRVKGNLEDNSVIDMALRPWISDEVDVADIPNFVDIFGITSFKFLNHFPKGGRSHKITGFHGMDDGQLLTAWEVVKDVGGVAAVHAEDPFIIRKFTTDVKNDLHGKDATLADWANARPNLAEYAAQCRDIQLAQHVGLPIYFVHTSARESVDQIYDCKRKDLEVYAEACPHYLVFTKHSHFKDDATGAFAKQKAPIRDMPDQERLWQGINDGAIDCLGSDHMETFKSAKKNTDIWGCTWGFPAAETYYPVMLSEGVNKGRISINRLVKIAAETPSRLYGLYPEKGHLGVGADADFVIVDLNKEQEVAPELFPSLSDFNFYDGMTLRGWPILTAVRGQVIMENGKIVGRMGSGKYLRARKYSRWW